MKYFWTFFWTFLLVHMLTYVTSSMIGEAYNFVLGTVLAVTTTIFILFVSFLIPNEPSGEEGVH